MHVEIATQDMYDEWLKLSEEVEPLFEVSMHNNTDFQHYIQRSLDQQHAFMVRNGTELQGMISISTKRNQIAWFAVAQKYQRQGIGALLLEYAITQLDSEKDISVVTFPEENKEGFAAYHLYKKFGFISYNVNYRHHDRPRVLIIRPKSIDGIQDEVLYHAENRRQHALRIIEKLDLLTRWKSIGRPYLHGSVSLGVMDERDIDVCIYSDRPDLEKNFDVVKGIVHVDGVIKARFTNVMDTIGSYYWQILYQDEYGDIWTIDNHNVNTRMVEYTEAFLVKFVERMTDVLTDELRKIIIMIKQKTNPVRTFGGIHVYMAVIQDGIRTADEFLRWFDDKNFHIADDMLWCP